MEDHSIIEDLKKAKEVLERDIYRGENNNKKLQEEINIKKNFSRKKITRYKGSIKRLTTNRRV